MENDTEVIEFDIRFKDLPVSAKILIPTGFVLAVLGLVLRYVFG